MLSTVCVCVCECVSVCVCVCVRVCVCVPLLPEQKNAPCVPRSTQSSKRCVTPACDLSEGRRNTINGSNDLNGKGERKHVGHHIGHAMEGGKQTEIPLSLSVSLSLLHHSQTWNISLLLSSRNQGNKSLFMCSGFSGPRLTLLRARKAPH